MQKKLHIKVGDTVKVLSGESRKSKKEKSLTIDRVKVSALLWKVLNVVKRHTKPSASEPQWWNRRKRSSNSHL